jgi:actin-related protein
MSDANTGIVIDNGSGITKAGFAGDDAPRSYFPTLVGKPKMPGIMVGLDQRETYVGFEANERRSVLNLIYPVRQGIIRDWEAIEDVWFHTLSTELRVPPDPYPLMITEPSNNPKANREKIVSTMFEEFKVPNLYLGCQTVLALYSSGKTTGVVLDSGEGITTAAPIYEGYSVPRASKTMELAGGDLASYLVKLLVKRGVPLDLCSDSNIIKDIKEKACRVSLDFEKDVKGATKIRASLPDSTIITGVKEPKQIELEEEKYICTELMFNPSIDERINMEGVHKLIYDSINACDVDIKGDMYKDIILSGGNTMFSGFAERLRNELKALAPSALNIKIVSPNERKISSWVGGSILGSLATFQPMYISRSEYIDCGPSIVHKKCYEFTIV